MTDIDTYINKLTQSQQKAMTHVRQVIKKTSPESTEQISYGMPAFKYKGKYLIAYGGFKNHMSLFPGSTPVAKLKARLAKFSTAKGTIQFTEDNMVPDDLIKEIVFSRVKEIEDKK
jgi:uncharacterized protein YdhG (YjbR/CyaY superfamily)